MQIAVGDKYSTVENGEGRFSVIINPVELCDDGEWKVSLYIHLPRCDYD